MEPRPHAHMHVLSVYTSHQSGKQAWAAVDVTFRKEGFIHFLKYLKPDMVLGSADPSESNSNVAPAHVHKTYY